MTRRKDEHPLMGTATCDRRGCNNFVEDDKGWTGHDMGKAGFWCQSCWENWQEGIAGEDKRREPGQRYDVFRRRWAQK